jgi:hypothetical protein
MLSDRRDNFSQFYEKIGCILIMQMQGNIHDNIKMNSVENVAIQVKQKVIAF